MKLYIDMKKKNQNKINFYKGQREEMDITTFNLTIFKTILTM